MAGAFLDPSFLHRNRSFLIMQSVIQVTAGITALGGVVSKMSMDFEDTIVKVKPIQRNSTVCLTGICPAYELFLDLKPTFERFLKGVSLFHDFLLFSLFGAS